MSGNQISSPFVAQQLGALAITAVLVAAAVAAARLRLVVGKDNRVSTSKTIALLWTTVVAYCLLVLAIIAATGSVNGSVFFADRIKAVGGVYLAMLGGPFASLVLAKVAVARKIDRKTLQKTVARKASIADITNNDEGRTDLVDFQYTVFNLVVMIYVVALFVTHPASGLVEVPDQIAILTGASAATYVTNKGVSGNQMRVYSMVPMRQRIGGIVTIRGDYLRLSGESGDLPSVQVGGVAAAVLADATAQSLQFTVPPPAVPQRPADSLQVIVTTTAGQSAVVPEMLTVDSDRPQDIAVISAPAAPGGSIDVIGRYLAGPPAVGANGLIESAPPPQPEVLADGRNCALVGLASAERLTCTLPHDWKPADEHSGTALLVVRRGAQSDPAPFAVTVPQAVPN